MATPDQIASSGGGGDVFGSGFLWKPSGDHSQKLVILTPSSFKQGDIAEVVVNGEKATYANRGNGDRDHWRFSKPGGAYGQATIEIRMKNGTVHKQQLGGSGALRYENGVGRGIPAGAGGLGALGAAGGGAGAVLSEPGPNEQLLSGIFRNIIAPAATPSDPNAPKTFNFGQIADAILGIDPEFDTTADFVRGLSPGVDFKTIDELKAALPALDNSPIPGQYRGQAQGYIDRAIADVAAGKTPSAAGGTAPANDLISTALRGLIQGQGIGPGARPDPFMDAIQGAFYRSLDTAGPGQGVAPFVGNAAGLSFLNQSRGPLGTASTVPGSPFNNIQLAQLFGQIPQASIGGSPPPQGGQNMPASTLNPFGLPGMNTGGQQAQQNPLSGFGSTQQWPTQTQGGPTTQQANPFAGQQFAGGSMFNQVPTVRPLAPGQEAGFGHLLTAPHQGKYILDRTVAAPQGTDRLFNPGSLSPQQSQFLAMLQQGGGGTPAPVPQFPGGGTGGFPGGGGGGGGFSPGGGYGGGGFGFSMPNQVAPGVLPSLVAGQIPAPTQQAFDTNLARAMAEIQESFGAQGARFGTDLTRTLGTEAGNANVNLAAESYNRAIDAYNALTNNTLGFGQLGLGHAGLGVQARGQDIQRELGLGNLDLERFLGTGSLALQGRGQDIQQQLGLGNLALGQGQLGLGYQTLQTNAQLQALEQALGLGRQLGGFDFTRGENSLNRALQEYLGQMTATDPFLSSILPFFGG